MNKVVHFELPMDDAARGQKFYEQTFGWKIQNIPEMNYSLVYTTEVDAKSMPKEPGAINGGMVKRSATVIAPSFAIDVENIEEALEKIKKGGGTILKEKTPAGPMGFIAYFKDTEGNVLSLWQNA